MKSLMRALAGMGIVGVLIMLAIVATLFFSTLYGLYLAFSASILLGIVVFLVEPSPLIIGLVMLFFHKNLAEMLITWLNQ